MLFIVHLTHHVCGGSSISATVVVLLTLAATIVVRSSIASSTTMVFAKDARSPRSSMPYQCNTYTRQQCGVYLDWRQSLSRMTSPSPVQHSLWPGTTAAGGSMQGRWTNSQFWEMQSAMGLLHQSSKLRTILCSNVILRRTDTHLLRCHPVAWCRRWAGELACTVLQ